MARGFLNMQRIKLLLGDITKQKVEAIVNAANKTLSGGGGVDGAIHRAAGLKLLQECKTLGGCKTGEAKITKGYKLPAKYVIHTVGPVYAREQGREAELLANCYYNSLKLAKENKIKTIAFPAISTGAFGYPKEKAAEIAVKTASDFLQENKYPEEVYFILFSKEDFGIYKKILK